MLSLILALALGRSALRHVYRAPRSSGRYWSPWSALGTYNLQATTSTGGAKVYAGVLVMPSGYRCARDVAIFVASNSITPSIVEYARFSVSGSGLGLTANSIAVTGGGTLVFMDGLSYLADGS
jgi:hypothetical protein